tara:strand:+ start:1253 stop:2029 length:777 start_codon:yes stop_codon:yes gene_type:complete
MTNRKYLIAANWKQNGNLKKLTMLTKDFLKLFRSRNISNEVLILPPSIYVSNINQIIKSGGVKCANIKLGLQNISPFNEGPFTGEISVEMSRDFGCKYALIGHSERRHVFHEKDAHIAQKIQISLKNNLHAILCVGETLKEFNAKKTKRVIYRQLNQALKDSLKILRIKKNKLIIAYEPVWAIGTGKSADISQIVNTHKYIQDTLTKILGKHNIKILYGGSVNEQNITQILSLNVVNGVLVGGASLNSKKFIDICSAI